MCCTLVRSVPYRFLYLFSTITKKQKEKEKKNLMVLVLFCIVGMRLRMVCAWWNVTVGSSEGQEP